MSASRLRTVSNVWPPWLPGALTGVENHLLASQTAPAPLLSMASFKTLSTTSILSPKPIPRVARPNRLLRSAATLPNYASIPSALFQPQPQHKNRQIRLFHQHRQQSNINKQSRDFETAAQLVKPQTSAYEPAESNSVPKWTPPASLEDRPVCIIGAGVLGRRLAVLWASRSRPVALYDTSPSALKSSRAFIAGELATYCAENGTQPGHVSISSTLEDVVQNAWMVIEAVPEDLEVKISLLGQLDRIVAKDVVIATNSEGFRSQELVGEVSNKERVLNTLYYIPPKNKCVEMMSCGYTSPSVILFLAGEMKGMGLKPIAVPGGGIKSMIFPLDVLFRDFFGSEKGVCEMMDEVGLDTVLKSEKSRLPNTRGSDCFWGAKGEEHVEWLQREFVRKGKLGDKTGEGLIVKRRRSVKGKKAKDSAGQEAWEKNSVDVYGL
ncbi:uncharacterized protein RCO7_01456 [Rhynchosporium graminicola]|uniref:3-hydroxyacyl-CoA dehydrogenase NAD binding domain-containing protein n=1 Tax=Rhynchosporium graminicola TaxID=2792576 RepID=A0A1E1K3N0_9HELO|nr:uncharacterized protein RCO7_01456 [Rhynchosporium commune]